MENRKYKIMETFEAEKVVEKALVSGRINMFVMLSYAERRKFNLSNTINQFHLIKEGASRELNYLWYSHGEELIFTLLQQSAFARQMPRRVPSSK
ncbi:MAG: hypothetical protein HQ557_09625 [Bacteroidetes bacterium]|nr:hypothetical protein [Bacteroidota bacterium]